jgi:hypothetical protein
MEGIMATTKDTGVTVDAANVINEILPFCAQGVDGRDLLSQADYVADAQRTIGHQPGIARQELANKQARQVSHMAAGLAQFLARRYAAGVKDNGDLDNVEAAIVEAVYAVIGPSLPGIATNDHNGLCRPDDVTIRIADDGKLSMITPGPKQALITVASYYTAGVYNWVVPDFKGDGNPWPGFIRIKGSGSAGGASILSGTRQGGMGGSEGTTVMRHVLFVPGETHVLTVGSGGVPVSGGSVTNGNSTSVGSITFAPGAGSTKAPTSDELMIPGATGAYGQSNYNDSNLSQTYGAPGAGTAGGPPGADGKYGGGGGGGLFKFQVSTPSLGGRGGDGFIEIFRMN